MTASAVLTQRPPARSVGSRLSESGRWSLLALTLSVLGRMAITFGIPSGLNMVDLRVYTYGAQALMTGTLYSFTYADLTPDFPLPFTYPPFAAILMLPLHLLPSFAVLGVLWQLATIAALWAAVRLSLTLMLGSVAADPRWRSAALLWTALGVWLEPVRTTLNFGQVNVFLVVGILLAANAGRGRWWLAGGLVGLLAGVKLTPAITGLYLVGRRNVRAAVLAGAVFVGTVAISFVLIPRESGAYFGGLVIDAGRVGPVGSAINQSMRGALSRIVGHDVGTGGLWLGSVFLACLMALVAWFRLGRDDRLGMLLVVQLLGLLVSPISWSHHWVWLLPAAMWLVHGPLGRELGARLVAASMLVILAADPISLLLVLQPSIWAFSRPWPLSVAGSVYPVIAVVVLALMVRGEHRQATVAPARSGDG